MWNIPRAGGTSGTMRGYLATPSGTGPFPAVLVIHENRGLNPYIEDVARRTAVAGFLALAPDGLAPVGGYPGQRRRGPGTAGEAGSRRSCARTWSTAPAISKSHALSNGKLGATGFCWGGGMVNQLAVVIGNELSAGVPFYGAAPAASDMGQGQDAAADSLRADGRTHQRHVARV